MLLSLDTSSAFGGFSLFDQKKQIGESLWGPERPHSETLTFEFNQMMNGLGLSPSLITDVLCTHGPGSFTGLRVGLNFAKSLCYVNQLQLTLSPSFRSFIDLKHLISQPKLRHVILLNAFKNQLFIADYVFEDGRIIETTSDTTHSPEELDEVYLQDKKLFISGDGFEVYQDQISESFKSKCIKSETLKYNPSVRQAELFFSYDHCLKFLKSDPLSVEPLYIKKSEAEEKLSRGQLKNHTQRKL